MSFGRNLQYLRRLSKNLTQEGLAEKLNVSRQTVSKWETDEAMPEMEKPLNSAKSLTALWTIFSGTICASRMTCIQIFGPKR